MISVLNAAQNKNNGETTLVTLTDNMLPLKCGTVMTIGNFDGVHRGHQTLINEVCRMASELSLVPAVWTFSRHTDSFKSGQNGLICDAGERASVLASLGIKAVYLADFMKYRDMDPETFVKKVLCGEFNVKAAVCGYDFRFGSNAKGDAEALKKYLFDMGIKCVVMPPLKVNDVTVSSTVIREHIAAGDVETASKLLGRPYGFDLPVVHGLENGRKLGFRTVNQVYPADRVVPCFGVYAVRCLIDGVWYNGVADIGVRPTVDEEKNGILCETHIFDFDGDLYGKTVRTELIKMMRREKRFDSFSGLKAQVCDDILRAKSFFAALEK